MMMKLRDEEQKFRLNLRKDRCHRRRESLRHKWREKRNNEKQSGKEKPTEKEC